MESDTMIIMDNTQDTRRNKNRFWASKKGRDIGSSKDLDKVIDAWIWTNEGYGKRGQIVVDTAIGYTWGSYPGNEEGKRRMKCELGGHKIWSTYEDGEDLHIIVWGNVKNPQSNYCQPTKSASIRPRTVSRPAQRPRAVPKRNGTAVRRASAPRTRPPSRPRKR